MPTFSTGLDVTFCEADDRVIFMDVARDRYLSLPPATERAFLADLHDRAMTADDRGRLEALVARGLLTHGGGQHGRWSPESARMPEADLWDLPRPTTSSGSAVRVYGVERATLWWRRRQPLKAILDRLADAKARIPKSGCDRLTESLSVGWASHRLGCLRTSEDRCLTHSIAVARLLFHRGIEVSLLFGVSARPFRAHCWVQHGDVVLTDRLENVTPFTPILHL